MLDELGGDGGWVNCKHIRLEDGIQIPLRTTSLGHILLRSSSISVDIIQLDLERLVAHSIIISK
jgi:hypothetical protein